MMNLPTLKRRNITLGHGEHPEEVWLESKSGMRTVSFIEGYDGSPSGMRQKLESVWLGDSEDPATPERLELRKYLESVIPDRVKLSSETGSLSFLRSEFIDAIKSDFEKYKEEEC